MALIIPNKILDSLVCDTCYKYLSVIPVKVFPNRKIMCGRCASSKEDEGIISIYNEVAKRSIFKCINRFDGCEALLTTSEVLQHEETCKSNSYECPICMEEVSSYLMIMHFKNNHNNFLLSTPRFVINKIDGTCQYFLYNFENYLVFIKFSSDPLSHENIVNASLNCLILDDYRTENSFKSNIEITYGNFITKKQVNCKTFPSDDENGLKIQLKLDNSLLNVMFSMEIPQSLVVAIPYLLNKELAESNYFIKKMLLKLYFKERDTFTTYDKIFYCFYCYTLTWRKTYREFVYLVEVSGKKYLICKFCSNAQKCSIQDDDRFLYNVSLFCKWMCGKHETIQNLQMHEKECEYQIAQPCPIKSCNYSCKLYKIEQHFTSKHNNIPKLVFGYSGNENYSLRELLSLKPNSNTKIVFVQSHVYITVEFVWAQTLWNVYLTCELPNAEPSMIILDESKRFIICIKNTGAFRHVDKIYYKCYLSQPKAQN